MPEPARLSAKIPKKILHCLTLTVTANVGINYIKMMEHDTKKTF